MAAIIQDKYNEKLAAYQEKVRASQDKAGARFSIRKEARTRIGDKLEKEGFEAVESKERMSVRMSMIHPRDETAYERVINNTDLLAINYLDRGIKAARSVCRMRVRDENGRVLGFGTAFLVSPTLLITNNHVLDRVEFARGTLVDFNFEEDVNFIPKDTKTFLLDPDRFFSTNEDLDYTLVAVRPEATDGSSLGDFGFLRLYKESGKVWIGEYVTIIQHPKGGSKEVTVRENKVVDMPGEFIHYLTDTEPGSSGSPVFNDDWQVVALHHAGVKERDAKGNVLSVDGRVWDPATMGEDRISWIANEGVRISGICQDLQSKIGNLSVDQQNIINEAISAAPPNGSPGIPPKMEVGEQKMEWYENSAGYDHDFLGKRVPLPTIPDVFKKDLVTLKKGAGSELKYTHFSVVMSKSRRLAYFTGVNIDGNKLFNIKRVKDQWYFDPRIQKTYQTGPELYANNPLDRGHLVRRCDAAWGDNNDEAQEANEDTFHFTNCSPQHKALNQQTWQNLEDYVLKNASRYGLKVVVFTGPVFREDDMLYRGQFQIPAEYWKVVAIVKEDGKLSATAYLQTQKNLIEDLEFAYGKYRTYQVPVTKIEALTKLGFGGLRKYDPVADIEGTVGRIITGPNDIKF